MMSDKPLVSIVVPVFNGERYIREAIDSLLGQTWRHLDLVVVDDGSTDGTLGILEGYEGIRVIRCENGGPPSARNTGIRESRGTYIAMMDADDIADGERIATQVEFLETHTEFDLVCAEVEEFRMGSDDQGRIHVRNVRGFSSVSLCARREVFDRVGLFDATLKHADAADWFDRARRAGIAMKVLPQILIYRRMHSGSFSNREAEESRHEHLRLLKRNLDLRRGGKKDS